jgi:hypothetical protein
VTLIDRLVPAEGGARMSRFVDATGYPVEPSLNGRGKPYWYRPDTRIEPRGGRWGGRRWLAVQRLFDHPDYPHTTEASHRCIAYRPDTSREIAFEVGCPHERID